ncbi:hypothetical protein A1O3_08974 [Capronia epimyces CBS 606.96]|uniref:Thioesterase domain-containing protein n=1 Tax=Capronia epimyces CBS 606.96 TaxID=1182542 RepID=W9XKE1_9EURO|nr:uncharacterized protein A1O3_08974 [Capronia epimyces CBS 606.96]EXJ77815.1 hypothetical protein A1O3_08974 [Capronia epimyces CBS 606.96]
MGSSPNQNQEEPVATQAPPSLAPSLQKTEEEVVEGRLQAAVVKSVTRQKFEAENKNMATRTRTLLKVSASALPSHLTASTLSGPSRISVPPIVLIDETAGSLLAFYHLGPQLSGHVGLVHGGFLAVLLDECMGRACFGRLPERIGVTVNLSMNYKKPVRVDSVVAVRAVTDRIDGRKAWVQASIILIEEDEEGKGIENSHIEEEKDVAVEATALFIQPRWAASMEPVV